MTMENGQRIYAYLLYLFDKGEAEWKHTLGINVIVMLTSKTIGTYGPYSAFCLFQSQLYDA